MLQQPNLESQLFVGRCKLSGSLCYSPIKFICNPFPLTQAKRLLQPDSQLIRSYAKYQALGLLWKTGSLRPRHDESELAFHPQPDGKDQNVLLSQMPDCFFRRLLRNIFSPLVQCTPKFLPVLARPEKRSSPERVDRGFVRVKTYLCVEEIEVKHYQEGIEECIQDSIRLAVTPDSWKCKDADQVTFTAL